MKIILLFFCFFLCNNSDISSSNNKYETAPEITSTVAEDPVNGENMCTYCIQLPHNIKLCCTRSSCEAAKTCAEAMFNGGNIVMPPPGLTIFG